MGRWSQEMQRPNIWSKEKITSQPWNPTWHKNNRYVQIRKWHFLLPLIAAHSFIDLIKYIFKIPGVTSFLCEKISQDRIEKYFGRQRQRGGVNGNSKVKKVLSNNQVLRVVNSIKIDKVNGSTRGSKQTEDIPFISDTSVSKNVKLKHSNKEEPHHQVQTDSPKLKGMFRYKIWKQCHVWVNYHVSL